MQTTADAKAAAREIVMTATRVLVGLAARSLAEVSNDVSLAQYRVLVLLDGHGPQTMGQLADSLGVNPSTVTRVCDVLVHKKFMRRQSAKGNRRTVRAELTARGQKLVDQVMARRRRLIDAALARMTPEAQSRLVRSLAELADAAADMSDLAWTFGWSIKQGDGGDASVAAVMTE
jgi:DNA-binding MarR family transcriptional regulator